MSLYPPLRPEQIVEIAAHCSRIADARQRVADEGVTLIQDERDVDELVRNIAEFRGKVAHLDRLLFQTWSLVYRLRSSNVPTTLPEPRRKSVPATLDDLEGMLS